MRAMVDTHLTSTSISLTCSYFGQQSNHRHPVLQSAAHPDSFESPHGGERQSLLGRHCANTSKLAVPALAEVGSEKEEKWSKQD
jgi:hypothetical protein